MAELQQLRPPERIIRIYPMALPREREREREDKQVASSDMQGEQSCLLQNLKKVVL